MDHSQWIVQYFKTTQLTVTPLNKGLTNDNVVVQVHDERFIVRFPKTDAVHIVNRSHEAKALARIAAMDLDVETVYFDEASGIKITRYVDDLVTFDDYPYPDRIERTAALMRRLHALNSTIGDAFDPIARYHQYRRRVSTPLISDELAQSVLSSIENLSISLTLCHNDWVPGNIGFSSTRDYLLDYEYAGDNDPYFDVMSFITENDITDDERQRFIYAYFGRKPTDDETHRLTLYEAFHNLLWCTWAMMMWESRHELIYQRIAQDKLNAFNATKK